MIAEWETNRVFLAAMLKVRNPEIFIPLHQVLSSHGIEVRLLHNVRDIWTKDYCPIQVSPGLLVKFNYDPDYLRNEPELRTGRKGFEEFSSLNPALHWLGLPCNWMSIEQRTCQLSTGGIDVQSKSGQGRPFWGPWKVQTRIKQWKAESQWEGYTCHHQTCADDMDCLRIILGRMIKGYYFDEWTFTLTARDNWPKVMAHGVDWTQQIQGHIVIVGKVTSIVTMVQMVSRVMDVHIPRHPIT